MKHEQIIVIWDDKSDRINILEANIQSALKQLSINAKTQRNCEIPLITRNRLVGKLPSFQINGGDMWHLKPNDTVTKEEFLVFFTYLKKCKILL